MFRSSNLQWWLAALLIVLIAGEVFWRTRHESSLAASPETPSAADIPTTLPTLPTTQPVEITPAAAPILNQMSQAYRALKSLDLSGTATVDANIGNKPTHQQTVFTSSYLAPNYFKYTENDNTTCGSTGTQAYVYEAKTSHYVQLPVPKPPTDADDYPNLIIQLLSEKNVSLLLALSLDPTSELTLGITRVDRTEDTKINGVAYPTLALTGSPGEPSETVLIDPTSHLVHRTSSDLKSSLENQGETDVRSATLVIDYSSIGTASLKTPAYFAWTPPAKAQDLTADDPEMAPLLQTGKPAPDFSLQDTNGKTIHLSDFKGHPVVLDFWATTCVPCLMSMPKLSDLRAELAPRGVQVFAINQKEDPAYVKSFLAVHPFNIPILLDIDGKVSEQYSAQTIPTTILVGPDGVIQRVFIGIGIRGEEPLKRAIEKLMH